MTFTTLALLVVGMLGRRGFAPALAFAAVTPTGAALVMGGLAVPTFYVVAMGATVALIARELMREPSDLGATQPTTPGLTALIALWVLGFLLTLVSPLLFDGMTVYSAPAIEQHLAAGVVTESNIAQILYLGLSVAVVAYLAKAPWAGPQTVGIALAGSVLLSLWAWSDQFGVPFPPLVFDNSPTFTYLEAFPGGAPRERGIFSEAAGLGSSCLAAMAYATSRIWSTRGVARWLNVGLLVISTFLGFVSTSTTFYIAAAALVGLGLVVPPLSAVVERRGLPVAAVLGVFGCVLIAVWAVPWIVTQLNLIVSDKVTSFSYEDRSGADDASTRIFFDTFGLGVGLGANRGSSFLFTQLSSLGVFGVFLLGLGIWQLVSKNWVHREVRPIIWTVAALLIFKVIAGPDLADTTGLLWLCFGVLAHAARARFTPSAARPAQEARA